MPHQCTGCGHTFEDGSKEMLSGCPKCGGNKFQFRPGDSCTDPSADDEPSTDRDDTSTEIATTDDPPSPADDPDQSDRAPDRSELDSSSVAETVGRATTKVRDFVSSEPTPSEPESDADWPDDWESGSAVSSSDGSTTSSSPTDSSSSSNPSGSTAEHNSPQSAPSGFPEGAETDTDDIIDADARRSAESIDEPKENAAQASARTDVVSSEELDNSAVPNDESRSPPVSPQTPDTDPAPDGEVVSEPTGEEPDLTELREQLNDQFESIKILEPGQYELNLMELYDREEYIIALQENGRYVIQVPEQWIGDDPAER